MILTIIFLVTWTLSHGSHESTRVSMDTVSKVLDELISLQDELSFQERAIRKCKQGECNHGKCLAKEGYCKCDKGWWGGYCDKVNACNEKACGSKTCFGDCPDGTAHCVATSKNAKGRFCYGPKFEMMEKYRGLTRSMVNLAVRISKAIEQ